MNAFILINAEPGKLWEIAETASTIEGIKIAQAVTGPYDVIVYVEFARIDGLSEIIDEIQSIDGVIKTTTAVTIIPRIH